MSITLPITPQNIGPVTALNLIKIVEKLGGSRGYLEHLRNANSIDKITQPLSSLSVSNTLNSSTKPENNHQNCYIHLQCGIVPGMIIGWIKVFEELEENGLVRVKYTTEIRTWITGGEGFTDLHGFFVVQTNWEDILQGPIGFTVLATEGKGLRAVFSRGCFGPPAAYTVSDITFQPKLTFALKHL
ncbi:unnamed protein product [Rhizoctonia solani]|uniref:Uncharacterized protein n=1 Tax=Rhizoctonia solani TaxID=456999 RepID=A0A8H3H776_9AGAM|nr:unnamed protein product [Rhizoctonia solani]